MDFFRKNEKLKRLLALIGGGAVISLGMFFLFKMFYRKQLSKEKAKIKLLTLTEDEAKLRASKVSDVAYTLFIQFNPDIDTKYGSKYEGCVTIDFNLNSLESNIFLDFAGIVKRVEINGNKVGIAKEGEKIFLKKEHLLLNSNKVTIDFENYYSHNKGLCYFHDKIDFKSYVYTNIEPCYTHLIFPCFNQPSIKASVRFIAATMQDWGVYSCSEVESVKKTSTEISKLESELNTIGLRMPSINKGYVVHQFLKTGLIPINMFGITAGHYQNVITENGVSILIRSSLYDKNYNYKNLSQTVIRSFGWMKTNLSSTISNSNIYVTFVPKLDTRSIPASNCFIVDDDLLVEKNHSQNILLHLQLVKLTAQIWFGIDMTPEWYDDLWLNKSFSTFFAYHILKQLSENVSLN